MLMRAVIDRFEGDLAVILLGDEEVQVELPARYLPEGAREGSILRVTFEVDAAETTDVRQRMQDRIDRLKRLNRPGK